MAYVELPFMEDIRSYPFAPLSIDTVKQEQLDAVDALIDDLLVVDSEETEEKENVLKVVKTKPSLELMNDGLRDLQD